MGNVIGFEEARDRLAEKAKEDALNKAEGARIRDHYNEQPLHGNLDSSDDFEQYHVYEVTKDGVWEVWTPYDNACVITFPDEVAARSFARDVNGIIGSGVAVYTGMPPIGPSHA